MSVWIKNRSPNPTLFLRKMRDIDASHNGLEGFWQVDRLWWWSRRCRNDQGAILFAKLLFLLQLLLRIDLLMSFCIFSALFIRLIPFWNGTCVTRVGTCYFWFMVLSVSVLVCPDFISIVHCDWVKCREQISGYVTVYMGQIKYLLFCFCTRMFLLVCSALMWLLCVKVAGRVNCLYWCKTLWT